MPGIGLGDPTTDHGADGRRQHRQHPGHHCGDPLAGDGEQQEDRREHRRYEGTAGKALHDSPGDQGAEAAACCTAHRGQSENDDARLYAEQGIDAQALLGHKSPDMTALYRDVRGSEWIEIRLG